MKELEAPITEYLTVYNENPKQFVWTKSADQILEFTQQLLSTYF